MKALCFGLVLMVAGVVIYRCTYENWAMAAFLVFFFGGGLFLVGLEGMLWQ